MPPASVSSQRWVYYTACAWAPAFGAPHTWWALGWTFGFPGGPANHHLWMTSWWRYLYDVLVILLSGLGAVVALALRPPVSKTLRGRHGVDGADTNDALRFVPVNGCTSQPDAAEGVGSLRSPPPSYRNGLQVSLGVRSPPSAVMGAR
jgi:hypothetical protein